MPEIQIMETTCNCLKCEKIFELGSHLKTHEQICKAFKDHIKCNDCQNIIEETCEKEVELLFLGLTLFFKKICRGLYIRDSFPHSNEGCI